MASGHQDSGAAPAASVFEAALPALESGGGVAPTGKEEARFDTNMVIILAALFFALLFAIGLNSLARCALRAIPVEVYSGGEKAAAEEGEDVCAICLGEFADGEKVRVLPRCGHGFHVRCVDAWLVSHGSCPTCRRQVIDGGGGGGGRAVSRNTPAADINTIAVIVE
uniref:RING-type domain-containing protein n=1 Tax=Leersia perrieri TaxID=77586 RepID=A0A0D9WHQ2_9ORYZ